MKIYCILPYTVLVDTFSLKQAKCCFIVIIMLSIATPVFQRKLLAHYRTNVLRIILWKLLAKLQ